MDRRERRIRKTEKNLLIIVIILSIFLVLFLGYGIVHKIKSDNNIIQENKYESTISHGSQEVKVNKEESKEAYIPQKLVEYKGTIEHIFFHPLISDINTAFKSGDRRTYDFDDWFITVNEFNKVLQSLYDKNYVLVSINDVYEEYDNNGQKRMRRKKLLIEEGKKPLILSVDDLSYNTGNKGALSDKLILTDSGEFATLTMKNNQEIISQDNEIIPILETFIKNHPDFSNKGAKGTLALTGYEGILGYRTHRESKNRQSEVEAVKPVIKKLKENGWTFASHSYGHNNVQKQTLEKFKDDTSKWENEVKPLVGDTNIYIYPHGWELNTSDTKLQYLQERGFRIFYSVGPDSYEMISNKTSAVLGDRMAIDGITLRKRRDNFMKFYDANNIIDLESRPVR